jgi:hypothetical protein
MSGPPGTFLDIHFRLRLSDLPWDKFELFFLSYLNSGISLTVKRAGKALERRVISAEMYAPGSGRTQDGIDLRLEMEGEEVWVIQCKKVKDWDLSRTRKAILRASGFPARHYFLAVACDTDSKTHLEMDKHSEWTLWNLDRICTDFKRLVPPAKRRDLLPFLRREEVKRFLPFATNALISPKEFFERHVGEDKPLRHDWPMVGRESESKRLTTWAEGQQKVLILTARGGEGKTRLIREFCERVLEAHPKTEVLFLNPFREDSDFSLGLNADASRRIIIIDDAHRLEQVPQQLLDQVRQDPISQIVLASRPQGKESIINRLREIGFGPTLIEALTLGPLKKPAAKELAKVVLGKDLSDRLSEFVKLTESNPFLITTAGSLLRANRLWWGSWATHAEFRRSVFDEFETENLNLALVPEGDREHARRLLRLIAVLSPVSLTSTFVERAMRLVTGIQSTEQLLNFLRVSELVVGPDENLRASPDLFADFLVYDACFDPCKRVPVWIKKVLYEFAEHGAVLIRNVSEAEWIAELNGVKDESIFEPLMKWQRNEFLKQSFAARQLTLQNWGTFSQYLPKQSLELSRLAMNERTAPADDSPLGRMSVLDDHAHVLKYIPPLLRPVAKYHLDYSHEALNLLWELGRLIDRPKYNNQNHPWTTIAEAFKFEDTKPRSYYDSALNWLEKHLNRHETVSALTKPNTVLRLFLKPCFSRIYDASYREGRTVHFIQKHVSLERSLFIRDRCLAILAGLIERGPAMVALGALSALEIAIQRAGTKSERGIRDPVKYREQWRPERLKALALYQKALETYTDTAVRYEIRRILKRDLIFEEDPVFAQECRKILNSIPEDLSLRTAIAMMSDYAYEFEDLFQGNENPKRFSQNQQRWNEVVFRTANEMIDRFPMANDLHRFLSSVVSILSDAGHTFSFHPLLVAIGNANPVLGGELAKEILFGDGQNALLQQWTALIDNQHVSLDKKFSLFEKAIDRKVKGAGVAVIRHLSADVQKEELLDKDSRKILFQIAEHAELGEANYLFHAITYSSEANLPWAFELFERLTQKDINPSLLGATLTAIMPIQGRENNLPRSLVSQVFKHLVAVPDLGFFEHAHVWDSLKKRYPFEVYELLRARIIYSQSVDGWEYRAVPHDFDSRVTLPELAKDSDIKAIVEDLWQRATASYTEDGCQWVKLFRAVALANESLWHDRVVAALESATSEDYLFSLCRLISFDGSLIIFSFPEITELFLGRAMQIGGEKLFGEMRAGLYGATGPKVRGYENGRLKKEYDYVECAAIKAAEAHSKNCILGPFYRWIVEAEQAGKLRNRLRAEEEIANE